MDAKTREIPQLSRLATFEPGTFNADTRTVELVWTVGARVARYDWWTDERYEEELDLAESAVDLGRLNSGAAPVLNSHDTSSLDAQIGVVERAWIKDGEGRAVVRLSQRDSVAGLVQDIRDGIIRNVSVGYMVRRYEITRAAGQLPLYRAVDWEPRELSFVTVPADAAAGTRSDETRKAPCEFITRATSAHPTQEEQPMERMDPNAAPAAQPESGPQPTDQAVRAAEQDAFKRAADMIELAAKHNMQERAAEWIRSGKSMDQVRAEILDAIAKRDEAAPTARHSGAVSITVDEADKQRAAGVNWILARGVVSDPATGKPTAVDGANPVRGYSLVDLARRSLERIGVRTEGLSRMDIVGRAFTQTSSDFPVLLETAMHKALQAGYATQADTWSRFCAIGSVSDFRAHNRYRVGSIGDFDTLTEAGEFKNKPIGDGEKATITASTKGAIINLTRQAIVNDDLDAFIGLAQSFGRAGRRTIEKAVYALLAANPTVGSYALFHSSHNNVGTAGVPSVTTFEEARKLMASQLDVSGNDYLDLRPAIFVGGMGTGSTARVVNAAEYDPDASNKLQRPNSVRGLVRDVVDTPRIANLYWYMFADPREAPVIEVAFLDGQQEPFLEMQEGFEVDGSKWKARLDFGVAAVDFRGAVRNTGGS